MNREEFEKLELRVKDLENILDNMEEVFVQRYGLIRHCKKPIVENGRAVCSKSLKPGASCRFSISLKYLGTKS